MLCPSRVFHTASLLSQAIWRWFTYVNKLCHLLIYRLKSLLCQLSRDSLSILSLIVFIKFILDCFLLRVRPLCNNVNDIICLNKISLPLLFFWVAEEVFSWWIHHTIFFTIYDVFRSAKRIQNFFQVLFWNHTSIINAKVCVHVCYLFTFQFNSDKRYLGLIQDFVQGEKVFRL